MAKIKLSALPEKAEITDADYFIVSDSEDAMKTKKIKVENSRPDNLDGNPNASSTKGIKIANILAGESISKDELVYFNSAGKYLKADAVTNFPAMGLAVTNGTLDNPLTILTKGIVRNNSWAWTIGEPVYLSETGSGLTQTAPTTVDYCFQPVGIALSAVTIMIDINPITGWGINS